MELLAITHAGFVNMFERIITQTCKKLWFSTFIHDVINVSLHLFIQTCQSF